MDISLTPQSEAFLQQAMGAGKSADDVINEAIALLQHTREQEASWLQTELRRGENSGPPLPYTSTLLDELEDQALADLATGNTTVDPSVWPVERA
ncbi:hypothetical protein N836_00220 [Leptolyngbya sp. Heron Island J]|uniref:ribbon-helix-helix domain-containing protein n=1 Tax=Leptolyngbya sp. Heron Island J TaxID=1385935 RepID=UPI0003B97087|nr:hypothetical protein [Leptolyngbya sp. Heron Island J]ESA37138.1 hypothetical protein N836_00220 [Leptolyngbya sp. Heron Island J]